MILLRLILIPFSFIYSIIIFCRNKFYDLGIFKSVRLSTPVISIGNITTGGTGKTPLTIFIAKFFLDKGFRVGIVSRGYKRASREIVLVSDGNFINRNVAESGDELILIAEDLIMNYQNNFAIAAGSSKAAASNYIVETFCPDIIILDDAFQHRRVHRDLDIVIVDSQNLLNEKFLNSFTLPSGLLREYFSNLKRADLIIQNNKDREIKIIPELERYCRDISVMRYKTEYFMDNKNVILKNYNSDAVIFSGIANNESFVSMVRNSGLNVIEVIKFPDHHMYNERDITELTVKYGKNKIFITTEKDFVRLRHSKEFINNYPVYFLKMKIDFVSNENSLYLKLNELPK
ncbi:MAG: tetraacyldisaccharide 4'-kinase [Bacteroidota bacterium]|nr:tetraacyldisaccharide 4'-kinase [Bacteroidota bacterium]